MIYIQFLYIQTNVKSFLEEKCRKLEIPAGKEPVLEKTSAFVDILTEVQDSLSPKEEIAQFFGYVGVGYYRLASLASESIVSYVMISDWGGFTNFTDAFQCMHGKEAFAYMICDITEVVSVRFTFCKLNSKHFLRK